MIDRRLVAAGVVAVVAVVGLVRCGARPKALPQPEAGLLAAEPAPPVRERGVGGGTEASTVPASTSPATAPRGGLEAAGAAQLGEAETAEADDRVVAPADQWRSLLGTDAPRQAVYQLIGDPASSDLAPPVARGAARIGAAFTVADASGVGREAFGEWWGERPAVPVAAAVRVLAAGAASHGRLVQVVVVWDGTAPDGTALGERVTTVVLEATSRGLWPVHPGDVR